MSANFILEYAGSPARLTGRTVELVAEHQAGHFVSEADAWWAAHQAGLNPAHCRVVNLYTESQKAAKLN